jgi:hypothetical protein
LSLATKKRLGASEEPNKKNSRKPKAIEERGRKKETGDGGTKSLYPLAPIPGAPQKNDSSADNLPQLEKKILTYPPPPLAFLGVS